MPPAGKRKANAMLDRIEKMAKQSEFDEERKKSDKYEVERKEYFESARAMFEESEKKETKEQYFDRLLKESTSLDKVLEFLKFRKQADKLLPNLREEMIKLVKKELEIDEALENLSLESNIATEEGTPLLEALGENETFEEEKNVDGREEQKHHKNRRGKWTRKQFNGEEKKTHKTQKTHSKRC